MKLNGWEHHIFPFSIGSIEKGYIMSNNSERPVDALAEKHILLAD